MSEKKNQVKFIEKVTIASAGTPQNPVTDFAAYSYLFENQSANFDAYYSDSEASFAAGLFHVIPPGEAAIIRPDINTGQVYEFFLKDFWFDSQSDGVEVVISSIVRRLKD